MAKRTSHINLLRRQEKPFIDRFLDWAFTVGRAIVIITETVALSAFAYRFILDREIIDLRDTIKQQTAVIKLSQTNEEKFRNLQKKITTAKDLEVQGTAVTSLLDLIVQSAQGRVAFSTVSIDQEGIHMNGIVSSPDAAIAFVNALREYPQIAKASIGTIQNDPSTGVITASFFAQTRLEQEKEEEANENSAS